MIIPWHKNLSGGDRLIKALVSAGLIAAVALLFFVPPKEIPFTTCEFYSLTGHSCLTCGMTRSLHAMAHGEFVESIRHHLMGPPVFLVMLFSFLVLSLEAAGGRRLKLLRERRSGRRAAILFFIVWLMYWGVRLATEFAT